MKLVMTFFALMLCASAQTPASITPGTDFQFKVMKTQRVIENSKQHQAQINQDYQGLLQKFNNSPEVKALQGKMDAETKKQADAQKELQAIEEQGYKDLKLDPKSYTFDEENMTYVPQTIAGPKTPPAPETK